MDSWTCTNFDRILGSATPGTSPSIELPYELQREWSISSATSGGVTRRNVEPWLTFEKEIEKLQMDLHELRPNIR